MVAGEQSMDEDGQGALVLHTRRSDLKARTPNQSVYLDNIANHDITFGIGPAGTGKTYLAVACAVDALERSGVQRIVLTRPAVEAGEKLGFLPGDLTQKVDPYLRPLYDALYDLMGFERVAKAFERNALEIAPLAFMRGRTLNNAFVILDEAQNTTPEQMKMFLTRIGFGSRCVVTGDISQIDLPKGAAVGAGGSRAHPQAGQGDRPHALHQRRRGAAPAGGAHRRCLRRGPKRMIPRPKRPSAASPQGGASSGPARPVPRSPSTCRPGSSPVRRGTWPCSSRPRSSAGWRQRCAAPPRSRCASSARTKAGR